MKKMEIRKDELESIVFEFQKYKKEALDHSKVIPKTLLIKWIHDIYLSIFKTYITPDICIEYIIYEYFLSIYKKEQTALDRCK